MAVAAILVAVYPVPDLTPAGRYTLAVFVLAAGMWIASPPEVLTPASLIVLVLVVLALAMDESMRSKALATAMSGYADPNLWLMILGFFYSAAFAKSGLAKRIALQLMSLARASTFRILFMVGVINVILSPTTPSTIAKGGLLLPIILGIIRTSEVEKGKSRFAKGIGIYAGGADNIISAGILTATISNPLAVSILQKGGGIEISWTQWFVYTFPMALISTLLAFFVLYFLFPPEIREVRGGAQYVRQELAAMGPLSKTEKVTMVSFLMALILWVLDKNLIGESLYKSLPTVLQTVIGLHVLVKGVIASLILFSPQFGVITWEDAEKEVPWGIYVLFGSALGLSAALNLTKGMDVALSQLIKGLGLEHMPFLLVYAVVVLVMFYGHTLFFTYTAMAAAMLPIIISLAKALNLPVLSLYVPAMALIPYSLIFPFNTVPLLMFSGAGLFDTKDCARFGLIFGLVVLLQWFVIGIPYWKALGIM